MENNIEDKKEDKKEDSFEDIEITGFLLDKISKNRESLYDMLLTLKEFRDHASELFPKRIDYKVKYLLEHRMNTFTQLYNVELAIRRHLDESVKTEIILREKMEAGDLDDDRRLIEFIAKRLEKRAEEKALKDKKKEGKNLDGK